MAYQGAAPVAAFQSRPAKQEFNGTGSATTFTLNRTVREEDIIVSVDGVVQEPTDSYTVPDGTTLTFSAAPSSGTGNIFVMYMGTSIGSVVPPDGSVTQAKLAPSLSLGAGYFQGENGATGDTTNGKGDIFRVHEQQLDTNTTIASGDNAGAFFSLTVATGVTLTVNGSLVIA